MNTNDKLSPLKVYYGWSVINKIRKRVALSVIFENEQSFSDRTKTTIRRLQSTFYIRQQTAAEAEDGMRINRVLTEYSIFLKGDKRNNDLEKILEANYQADINNVPVSILEEIKETLRKSFKLAYVD